jgi:cytochrome c oxidase subunit 4
MVLDSKHMEWASRQGLETAALKKAKVPIFGKWYFPDLPANVPLVNLSTGEVETFPAGFRAGAVLYVKEEDLKRAGIGPYKAAPVPAAPPAPAAEPVAAAPAAVAVAATPAQAVAAAAPPAPAPSLHHTPAPAAAHAAPSHGGGHAPAAAAHGAVHAAAEHAHPGPKQYVIIALILCVITAVEVWVYYVPALLPYIFPILIVLSLVKFVMVVGWFMHLKFDHISFTWYFGGGLALAVSIVVGLIFLQIGTHGMPPGDGNAHTFPPSLVAPAPSSDGVPKPAGGH